MSHRSRSAFSWSSALRDMRNDRVQVPQGFLGSRERIRVAVRLNVVALVKADGSFDRAGIMSAAAAAAKKHQLQYGSTWAVAMSVSLKAAWQLAKSHRPAVAH
ncbi:hypothetical protein ASG52_24610 [Methylobacterium sp. Leaf456]|uniref:hypothetical protein n=1 Tax=Methylobacterium sp. Leaf456 TaxID=1736382 RepID=UPI0006FABFD5|nr:hypothetical protein [Methylobacterium sp. Leaf456]KQT56103.1 hypothetical protein ASG52_24610 [Methylobacterium sp. Leaf456]